MKTACLALLLLSAVAGSLADGNANTYISNQSFKTITATISYSPNGSSTSAFINRIIAPHTYQSDTYTNYVGRVIITLWVQGSGKYSTIDIPYDNSIVAFNNCGASGVDIFLARYGTRVHREGSVLTTIYP